jgi:hypothetical protein
MRSLRSCLVLVFAMLARVAFPQPVPSPDAVRVTVSLNADGSRTTYRFDDAHRKAVATTKSPDGKLLRKTRYTLDDAGRFSTSEVYGPDSRLRFKSTYKCDETGRQTQELQSDKNDTLMHKIVYTYDSLGKPTGYSVYDGSGKLVGRTIAPSASPSPAKRKAR